ncbi:hypothetical protein [Sphingobacterium griseoflavum]|uniref:Phage tail protein n=1 Tax=Sphingobacterium griseoflavum TaxID=1474952 RepID=A0ABQ3HXP8_9SPHI|nr:hypothetical protein [Sphingobacterium griseoflavum]GHE34901.1 hypothetical protein GCM10017764_17620 [Sphingobacterium griseoflavum]
MNKNIKGHEGTLARWDAAAGTGGAWKPVGCLTSSAYQATMNMLEKVNMCTEGQTVQSPQSMTRSVQIEGEVIDTTDIGGSSIDESFGELRELQETEHETGNADVWRLSRGPLGYLYFPGFISDLSDSYAAGEDATFSATLTVNAKPTETDPNA